jgi:ferrochelatase
MTQRLAVVLMNLGGPDSLKAVRPFLKNLFSDPAIINLSWPARSLLSHGISWIRAPKARKIYEKMGGKSPLLANTQQQQACLQDLLHDSLPHHEINVFIAMRYWHPLIETVVAEVKKFGPDEIILLPLYPQFSTTTTGSSFTEWHKQARHQDLRGVIRQIEYYCQEPSFIQAHVDLLVPWIEKAQAYGSPRLLFSAHGLPQKIIDAGDPYENQIHQTKQAILDKLPHSVEGRICYQSKVGPLKWLGPSTEEEVRQAGKDKAPVVMVPIAFVSEHAETLVELDDDYKFLAQRHGVPFYGRVPTVSDHPAYIQALANLVKGKLCKIGF